MPDDITVKDAGGLTETVRATLSGGVKTPHHHVDNIKQPTALVTETITSTGAASEVGFASAALSSGVAYVYAPSTNVSNCFVNKVGSADAEVGILLEPGKQHPLPPADNANAYEVHFVGASPDKAVLVAS